LRIVKASNGVLLLGKKGENLATQVQFDVKDWIEEFGTGSFALLHQRKTDTQPHAVVITTSEGIVYWNVADTEVAIPGPGVCELQLTVGTTIAKSVTWVTTTIDSLSPAGNPPAPWQSWVTQVLNAASSVEEAVEHYPYIDETSKHWIAWDVENEDWYDTGVSAKGENGISPHIGANGNWWIGDVDTGVPASGTSNDHRNLSNRNAANQHTMSAITGLVTALEDKYDLPDSGIPYNDLSDSVQDSLDKADTALQSVPDTYRTSAAQDTIDATKLKEPSSGMDVGKYFRIASIDASGHAVLEAVDAPSSAMKIKLAGTAKTPDSDGYVNIPAGTSSVSGLCLPMGESYGIWFNSANGAFAISKAENFQISARTQHYKPIVPATVDYAVKAAMTDGVGAAWTDSEKAGAWSRLNSIKTTMDAVAVAGAEYFLGEQSSVAITLPSSPLTGQEIEIVFYSGATATTLTCSSTFLGTLPTPSANQRIELNFLWDGTNWDLVSKAVAVS